MELPVDLLCGPIASFLDRTGINRLGLTCKVVHQHLLLQPLPWPTAARFFFPHYARVLAFSPDGQWLACGGRQITLWNREQRSDNTNWTIADPGSWINLLTFSSSSLWLVYGNSKSPLVCVYHMKTMVRHWLLHSMPVKKLLVDDDDVLYTLTENDLSLRKLGEINNFETQVQCLCTEVVVKDMALIASPSSSPNDSSTVVLALWTEHNQILLWNLNRDYKEPLPLADGVDILALLSSMDGSLAVVTKPSGTRSISLELWSSANDNNKKSWICQQRIPLEQHSHVTSMILIDKHTWVTADASWDTLLVWRNEGECVGSLGANFNRLGFACRGEQLAWIGCGSTVWLRDLRDFAST
jgi:WD40 repeat protein